MHLLCLKVTCPQELFIVWRHVTFNTFMYLLTSKCTSHWSVMGMLNSIYCLVGLRTESSVSDEWLILLEGAHDQLDTAAASADAAAEICPWHSTCLARCSLLVIVGLAWWSSSNSWAAMWPVMYPAQTRLLLTPRFKTSLMSHAFNLTFGKTLIPSENEQCRSADANELSLNDALGNKGAGWYNLQLTS